MQQLPDVNDPDGFFMSVHLNLLAIKCIYKTLTHLETLQLPMVTWNVIAFLLFEFIPLREVSLLLRNNLYSVNLFCLVQIFQCRPFYERDAVLLRVQNEVVIYFKIFFFCLD